MRLKIFPLIKKHGILVIIGFCLGLILALGYEELRLAPQGKNAAAIHDSGGKSLANPEKRPGGISGAPGDSPPDPGTPAKPDPPPEVGGEVQSESGFTVLLVGVDNRPGEVNLSNTDTLILANYAPAEKRLALLSIPRDTQIMYPGFGRQKINAAARLGKSLKATVRVTENLTGQKVDGYIKVNFAGFKEIIDTLGGITLTVEKDMYYNTGDKVDGTINLKKGTQHLNGSQALQYARFRHDNLADISRTMRQQTVVKAMVREILQPKTLTKLPWLIPQVYRAVETDLPISRALGIVNLVRNAAGVEMVSQTLPGRFLIEEGISYWKVGASESRSVIRSLFHEGKTCSIFSGQSEAKTWGSWIEEGDRELPVMSPDIFGEAP